MQINRRLISQIAPDQIYLLSPENERFLKWEKLLFWDEADRLQDDFPSRIPLTVIFGIVVLFSIAYLLFHANRYQTFASEGVFAWEELSNKETGSLGNHTQFYLSYTYSYGNERYTRTVDVLQSEYESATLGNRRRVLILPSNRELIFENRNELLIPLILALLGFLGISALGIYTFYRWYRPILLIPAKITQVEQGEKHTNRGVHPVHEISYEFTSPRTKTLLKGRKSISLRQDAAKAEQLLAVLYRNDTYFLPL